MFALIYFCNNNLTNRRIFKGVLALAVALLILLMLDFPVLADTQPIIDVNLQISASWGGGDILNLDITDLDTGERQQIAIRLSDFLGEDENVQYILLQAMDLLGERQSGVIQIENPLFDPTRVNVGATVGDSGSSVGLDDLPDNLQNIIAEANKTELSPTLTPDGTGTVVDNIMTVNDIEFFTVTTDGGNDFFLVVDRQRTSNNVYLLNTVTEADLAALAEARGDTLHTSSANASAADTQDSSSAPTMEEILLAIQEAAEQNQHPAPPLQNPNSGILFLLAIVLVLAGGAFAFWRFVLPLLKKSGQGNQYEEIEEDLEEYDNADDEDYNEAEFVEVDKNEGVIPGGDFNDEDFPSEDFTEHSFVDQGGEDDD